MNFLTALSHWQSWVEIAVLFAVIYTVLYMLRKTRGILILGGFLFVVAILWGVAKLVNFQVLAPLFEHFYGSLILLLAILFQPELRLGFTKLASLAMSRRIQSEEVIDALTDAVQDMARRKCGALIVIERKLHLQMIVDEAEQLDAKVTAPLLESIFYPNSPLHDGAVIIRNNRIIAAQAVLPLTRENLARQLGTRHRAAQGISEESDSVTLVVSEETGSISLAHGGHLYRDLSSDNLKVMLNKLVVQKDDSEFKEAVQHISAEDETGDLFLFAASARSGEKKEDRR